MLRRLLLLSSLLLISNLFYGQIVTKNYESDEFQTLLKSELNIILSGKAGYDTLLKEAVRKYWKVTEYKFITKKDALYAVKDESKSFMFPMKLQEVKQTSYGPESSMNHKFWLTIVIGGEKRISKYNDNDVIVLSPLNYWCDEKNIKDASYRIDYIIKGMNDGISIVRDNKISDGYLKRINAVIDEINTNSNQIEEKTLIINADAIFTVEYPLSTTIKKIYKEKDFKKDYPYKYKFVDEAEYLEIVQGNSSEYLIMLMVIEVNTHILIYDPSSRKTVYYGFKTSGTTFKKGDIKDLLQCNK